VEGSHKDEICNSGGRGTVHQTVIGNTLKSLEFPRIV
jgi:hypothetical protein